MRKPRANALTGYPVPGGMEVPMKAWLETTGADIAAADPSPTRPGFYFLPVELFAAAMREPGLVEFTYTVTPVSAGR